MRLVAEARERDRVLSLNAAVLRIGPRVGVNADTLPGRCKQAAHRRRPGAGSGLYGARKSWHQLRREGAPVARCTVERLT
jgi:hypothetical protein